MKQMIAVALVLAALSTGQSAVSAQEAGRKKWEYAVLIVGFTWSSETAQARMACEFTHGKVKIEADSLDELAKKLKAGEKASELEIIDHLGSQGWEMSGAVHVPPPSGLIYPVENRWYFKRECK